MDVKDFTDDFWEKKLSPYKESGLMNLGESCCAKKDLDLELICKKKWFARTFSGFFTSLISLKHNSNYSKHKFPIRDALIMEFVGAFCGL